MGEVSARAEPWRAPTDEEYDRLDLPEKIRTHTSLALLARDQAGPMWGRRPDGSKGPLTPEQLPEKWHFWIQRARNHEAEVRALRSILTGAAPKSETMRAHVVVPALGAPQHDFSKSQGNIDGGGLTPQMRALLARQSEEAAQRQAQRSLPD
jgi:hypothetical protein